MEFMRWYISMERGIFTLIGRRMVCSKYGRFDYCLLRSCDCCSGDEYSQFVRNMAGICTC